MDQFCQEDFRGEHGRRNTQTKDGNSANGERVAQSTISQPGGSGTDGKYPQKGERKISERREMSCGIHPSEPAEAAATVGLRRKTIESGRVTNTKRNNLSRLSEERFDSMSADGINIELKVRNKDAPTGGRYTHYQKTTNVERYAAHDARSADELRSRQRWIC